MTQAEEDAADITLAVLLGGNIRPHIAVHIGQWKWAPGPADDNYTTGFSSEAAAARSYIYWYRNNHRTIKP